MLTVVGEELDEQSVQFPGRQRTALGGKGTLDHDARAPADQRLACG
jgi:hypothetical protein